jgi:2,3-bisphosphoglycerate-dependent phosphoglycerate mutase
MEFLIVRHAEPVAMRVESGAADPALTMLGRAQADALAACPALGRLDVVAQSPSRRAVETARPIAERFGIEPVSVPGLAEFDHGQPEYVPVEQLRALRDERWDAMMRGEAYGEVDVPAFRARVTDAFAALAAANPGQRRVVVVCHSGVINAYIGDVIGMEKLLWFAPAYSSISRVAAARDGRRGILSLNETPHLLGLHPVTTALEESA